MTFAELVKQTLAEHGLNARSQRVRTRIDHVTLGDILEGQQPRMETVIKFARGFGLDPNRCLELAGHEPVKNTIHKVWEALDQVRRDTGEDFQVSWSDLAHLRERPDELQQYAARLREGLQGNP